MNHIPNESNFHNISQNMEKEQTPKMQPPQSAQTRQELPYLYGTPFTVQPPAEKPHFKGVDALFAFLSVVVGYLFVRSMPVTDTPLGGMLFLWLLFCFGIGYLLCAKIQIHKLTVPLAVGIAVLSLGLITNGNHTVQGVLFLLILLAFAFWCYLASGLGGKNPFSERLIPHLYQSVLALPLSSIWHIFPAFGAIGKKGSINRKLLHAIGWALLGLAVAVIPTTIVILLLSYDQSFTALLDHIFSFSLDGFGEFLGDLILGFLSAIVLFAILSGIRQAHVKNNGEEQKVEQPNLHILHGALLCAAVTPILAVYVIFFISQWSYYVSAFTGILPEDLTYATYAREGFFQLCGVCAINAVMLLLFNLLMKERSDGRRSPIRILYSCVISIFTLILIATALSKMALYIGSYGLTQKRVYASWFMLLLAVIFILVLLSCAIKRLRLLPAVCLVCVLFFALIAIPNVDGMIADYNVDAYLSNDLKSVDVYALSELGSSAVPALVDLKEHFDTAKESLTAEEETVKILLDNVLKNMKEELDATPNSFFRFNLPDHRARIRLQ